MTRLPQKRPKVRSGILRSPERVYKRHRRWIRSLSCAVPGCPAPVVPAHLRTAANSGTGLKPHDWYLVPLCVEHHSAQEGRTQSFNKKYGIDLFDIAAGLAEKSPDMAMRAAMREIEGK